MARQLRFDPPGGWHHVMHRGSRHQAIFLDDVDCENFMRLVDDAFVRWGIELHAYALMGNHYHLLARSVTGELSKAMKHLNARHAQAFNHRHDFDGHLFRGRFRSILIGDDAYLVEVARYIHRNPITAGLAENPSTYRWSSHPQYQGLAPAASLITGEVLRRFGGDSQRFDAFVRATDSARAREVLEAVDQRRPAIGPAEFLDELLRTADVDDERVASARRLFPIVLDDLDAQVAQLSDLAEVQTGTRTDLILVAATERRVPTEVLAQRYGLPSGRAVSVRTHRTRKRAANNSKLGELLDQVRSVPALRRAA